ncbi:hypothetical protein Nepgr_028333 [Nepenthes gracilis]|uniref:Uncharacterized protein n=1 Tax=Nepenthes gracilis TaxID=150966 RepID=A0AAD3Y3U6_NEPGR|nr:hypothetical protein Nepgr_028333 [Nepenthes gracilis]
MISSMNASSSSPPRPTKLHLLRTGIQPPRSEHSCFNNPNLAAEPKQREDNWLINGTRVVGSAKDKTVTLVTQQLHEIIQKQNVIQKKMQLPFDVTTLESQLPD